MSRIEPLDRDIALILDEVTSPEARSARLAEFAAEQIEDVRAANRAAIGGEARFEQYVDGRRGAPLTTVRPDGVIVADFDLVREAMAWIGAALLNASPVRSGRFVKSFVLLADGMEIEPSADLPAAEEYVFTNSQPYTRKIERGLSKQAPDGVFEGVASVASRQFGNSVRVAFGYRSLEGTSALDDWAKSSGQRRSDRRSQSDRESWLRRQPAIIVRPY